MIARKDRTLAMAGCCLAIGTLIPVALFQSGWIERLPDPPSPVFDSETITSGEAAHPFGIPDSYPGLASYATTLALLLLAKRHKSAQRLLGAKLMGDASLAAFNVVRQVVSFRKLCSYCTGTALATALIVYGGREAMVNSAQAAKRKL